MSFDEFLSRRLAELLRFAGVLCGSPDRAERIVADVVVRAFPHWAAIAGVGHEFALLRTAVVRAQVMSREDPTAAGSSSSAAAAGLDTLTCVGRAALVLADYSSQSDGEISAALRRPPDLIAADLAGGRAALDSGAGSADPRRSVELLEALADGFRFDAEAVASAVLDQLEAAPPAEPDPAVFEAMFALDVPALARTAAVSPTPRPEPAMQHAPPGRPISAAQVERKLAAAAAAAPAASATRPVTSPDGRGSARRIVAGAVLVVAAAALSLTLSTGHQQHRSGRSILSADHSTVPSGSAGPIGVAPGLLEQSPPGTTIVSQHVGAGPATIVGSSHAVSGGRQLAINAVCSGPGTASIGEVVIRQCNGSAVFVRVSSAEVRMLKVQSDPATTWRVVVVEEPVNRTNGVPRFPVDPALKSGSPASRVAQAVGSGTASVDLVSGTTTSRIESVHLILTCRGSGITLSSGDHSFDGDYTRTCRPGWSYQFNAPSALVPGVVLVTASKDTSWTLAVIRS